MAGTQRQGARKFREYWTFQRGSEKGEDQQFWNSLLRDVLGVADVERHIQYQVPVPMSGTTKFLDAWIPETRVLVEHKSRGVNLDAQQASHGGKTPYQQAVEYDNARPYGEKARWIVVCNFDEFRVHDMENPLAPPQRITLADLPKEISRLGFLVDAAVKSVREKEKDISIKAGRIVGELYKALLKRYAEPDSPETLKALNRLCVRLVFVFYAEDADIFPKDAFWNFLNKTEAKNLRRGLLTLFRVLDFKERDPYLEPELSVFPYTNGGLFKDVSDAEVPPLDEEIRQLLIKSADFDWRDISPTIFGALFESTLNPETRRSGGMVYTSVENIHKVIDPLFLDGLEGRVDEILATKNTKRTKNENDGSAHVVSKRERAALLALQDEMSSLTFLDPACGSGNFLTETYLSLRRLENRIIAALQNGQGELYLDDAEGTPSAATANRVKVSIAQFHGIEINDFAVSVAKTALWIAEAQMLHETAEILHREPDYLPLKDYDGIVEGNALRMDWAASFSHGDAESRSFDYIIGNPPFSGARWMGKSQKEDMLAIFGKDWQGVGDLDYVTAWYKKAMDYMGGPQSSAAVDARKPGPTHCAFVSTNSICQGGSVANLWKPLFANGLEIDFAHRTFRWDNESFEKAHVHCVIVGFHATGTTGVSPVAANGSGKRDASKLIFDNGRVIPATHINGYLMNAPDVWVESRTKPICDVPEIGIGNKPIDGGNYLFTKEEKNEFLKQEPRAAQYFHPWYGADEFLNGSPRYCLWLGDCTPAELFKMPEAMNRVQAVREYRLSSKSAGTRKIADKPTRFHVENFPQGHYIVIPEVSSERRRYVPMGYLSPDVICSNKLRLMPDATLYHFGVLNSSVHNDWVRAVCGRLETRYDYSINIVYNNFPWPDLCGSASLREKISQTAQAILDARAKYPGVTLAQMYGDKMYLFPELVAAHEANDRAVLAAYGLAPDTPEPEIVAHLFKLYAEMTKKEGG